MENKFFLAKEYLKSLGVAQTLELSTKINIPFGTLMNITNGRSKNPGYSVVHVVYEMAHGKSVISEFDYVASVLKVTDYRYLKKISKESGVPYGTSYNIKYGKTRCSRYNTVHALYSYLINISEKNDDERKNCLRACA